MKKNHIFLILLLSLTQTGWAQGQRSQLGNLQQFFFPPELVMRNQQELELTEEQRDYIVKEIQQAQSEFTGLRWDVQNETQHLKQLLEKRDLDEAELLAQFETVLDLERNIKRTQLIVAVRIRNVLNDEQLKKLEQLKATAGERARRNRRPGPETP
ncbi:MAG TPA: hypothetical protein VMY18_09625 [Acidobacteriota bacterium]|nr:hypothetical protein [Acidobacteriota bacterium]